MRAFRKLSVSVLLVIFVLSLLACDSKGNQIKDAPVGVAPSILVESVSLTFVRVQLRKSVQTHYLMHYPEPGHVFLEAILNIEGLNASPEDTLAWGRENLSLNCANTQVDLAFSRRIIVDDHVEYKVGEQINFNYVYIFQLWQGFNPTDCTFDFLDGQRVDLDPLLDQSTRPTAPTSSVDLGAALSGQDNQAQGENAFVGGGSQNSASAIHTTVGGGNLNIASSSHATVGGGRENSADGFYTTVAGGYANIATARDTFVGGGSRNIAEAPRATVGGGIQNQALGPDTTIAGGAYNQASDDYAVVCGGTRNLASGYASVIGGGAGNIASNDQATVAGGLGNQVDGKYGVIGGGYGNKVTGDYATTPGGFENQANAAYSFAVGKQAVVASDHTGAFVFADAGDVEFASIAANEFAVRASGGIRFVSAVEVDGAVASGVQLPPGSGSWATLSDRNAKNAIFPVDVQATLAALADLPITTWQYQTQDASIRHMGPMAQDFYSAFGLGEGERYISAVDADGVAFAAIQGLYELVQQQQDQLKEQNLRMAELEARLGALERTACQNQKSQPDFILWLGLSLAAFLGATFWLRWKHYNSGLSSRKPCPRTVTT